MHRACKNKGGDRNKKLIEAAEWQWSDSKKYFTEVCHEVARSKGENAADCEKCEHNECKHRMPNILEGNRDVWHILHFSPSIWKYSMNGIVGLDYPYIVALADMLDIAIDGDMIEKLRIYESHFLKKLEEQQKETKE